MSSRPAEQPEENPAERSGLARALIERYPDREADRIAAGHLGFLVFEATAEAKLVQPSRSRWP